MLIGVWPAFWTLGSGTWPEVSPSSDISVNEHVLTIFYSYPQTGEIDVIEGVHDNEHNQVTWHTNPGTSPQAHAIFSFPLA